MSKNTALTAYRSWGYLKANLDYFNRLEPITHPDIAELKIDPSERERLEKIYCGPIGAEFMHIPFRDRVEWITNELENTKASPKNREWVLKRLASAELFEGFLHTRYVAAKRFSLEGSAAIIPIMDRILTLAAEANYDIAMIAMAHRGRLTVISHCLGSSPAKIFADFEDVDPKSVLGSGDVKYHRGANGVYETPDGKTIRVHLSSNPSHLEAVNPVIMGRARARQERLHDTKHEKVLCIILHGDAAFAGQGITAETLNFAQLRGFNIGGTIQIITNNLMGFTAVPSSLHSSRFASDAMKRLPAPIFHVNGEEVDAAVRVAELAFNYRHEFKDDVLIDSIGYRKYGHNEADDPTATSPVLYEALKKRPQLYKIYAEQIGYTKEKLAKIEEEITTVYSHDLDEGRTYKEKPTYFVLPEYWNGYEGGIYKKEYEARTGVALETIQQIANTICKTPENFNCHPKVLKLLEQRIEMSQGKRNVDWGAAELFAFGSLLLEGHPVRLVGQDSRRGTFNHRHAVQYDMKTNQEYIGLRQLNNNQSRFAVYDSQLSEAAAVGFEYGFSRDYPEALVCWEAQFGDFVNGAQIIIDQFLSAGEDKWGLLSGLVLLLPHGFEGQGPEHSSARLERFLQLCGEDNMQVCVPSNAGQHFHLLRRQVKRPWRKPLIVMTPKSMLRAAPATVPVSELENGQFQTVIGDAEHFEAERVLICSGKISHELTEERRKRDDRRVAIVRLEQLYPFPEEELRIELDRYTRANSIVWVQEEPANMGALFFVKPFLDRLAGDKTVRTVKRSASASPATGSPKAHALEQQAIIQLCFAF